MAFSHVTRGFRLTAACWALLTGVALLGPDQARAQLLQGSIAGNVMDPSQAAVADAAVVAANQQTNFTREARTNSVGGYALPTLPPGTYTITVKSSGFQPYSLTGVVVETNSVTRVDVTLKVGQLTETLTVEAHAASLQTDRADVRSEITSQTLDNVPVPMGRNYQMLFVTLPGVSPPQNTNSFGANPSRAVQFSVNGGSVATNTTRIDGTSSNNPAANGNSAPLYVPAMEAIESVNVVSNSFDAEQGMAGGSAVNLQIKTGSNAVHGSLFGDHADQHLKAYAWAADRTQPKPKYIYNQFGGTIGGPIKRDKLFYFLSYEGTRYRESTSVYVQAASVAMSAGNLSASPTPIYDPMTGNPDGSGRQPFAGNIIPQSRIDIGVQKLLASPDWPKPNQAGTGTFKLGRDFLRSGSGGQRRDQWDAKLTWNPSSKLSTFVRFGFNDNAWDTPQAFASLGGAALSRTNGAVGIGFGHIFSGTISGLYVFSPKLIVDAYYGYSRNDASTRQQRLGENLGWTFLQIPGLQSSQWREGGWPALLIDGFGGFGPPNNYQPQDYRNPEKEYAANLTWLKASHNLRAGIAVDLQHMNENQEQASLCTSYCNGAGGFQFSQGTTQLKGGAAGNDLNAFASFLLGLPANVGKIHLFPDEYHTRSKTFGAYVRDQWQVTPKLTLTYGVRWEYFPFPTRVGRGLEFYNFQSNQMMICGLGSTPMDCGITKDKQRFAPRAGLAYRLTGSTVFRAGYGLTNDPTNLTAAGSRQNFPDSMAQQLNAPNSLSYATTLRQGLPPVTRPDPSTGVLSLPSNIGVYTYDNSNYVRSYIQSWNATVEQRLGDWIASAGYVATRTVDAQPSIGAKAAMNLNWAPIGGGTAGQVLTQKFGRTAGTSLVGMTMGTHRYDSLQVRAQHRLSRGFQVGGSYTYAKAFGYSTQVAIPYYYNLNYGPLATDLRHNLQATWVLEAPFGKGRRWARDGAGAKILGGWQLNGLSSFYGGRPFTATASSTSLNSPGSTQFADCAGTPKARGDIYQWYDKSGFAVPAAGRFGTCSTNSLWGPGLINVDLGLDRKFAIRERIQLKFRAEVFNLGNTPHHAIPNSTNASVNSSTFMQALDIANTGREGIDERAMRLTLRLSW